MEDVSSAVSETTTNSVDVVKGLSNDIIEFKFYKNLIFLSCLSYSIFIFGTYLYMSDTIKNSYVFSDKFRTDTGDIHWLDILTYPYDPFKSTSSIIYSVLSSPIILYLIIFTFVSPEIINPLQSSHQAYFYMIMFSLLLLLILFTIHILIFNFIISPKDQDIELRLGDQTKQNKSYESFYRTQWVLLFTLSPIYVCIMLYIIRKLSS